MSASLIQVDVIIPTQTKYLDLIGCIGERIVKELDQFAGDREVLAYQLNLVLTEATVNAIKHRQDNDAKDTVRISIHLHESEVIIKVFDHGQGFNLDTVPLPDFEHPSESGMGIYFIRTIMDSVTYTRMDDCNVLEMTKNFT